VQHQHAEPGGGEGEEGGASPLTGGDPDPAGAGHQRHQGEARGVEEMLSPPADRELAGDGDDAGQHRQRRLAGAQQQRQGQPGDQGAPRVEARQPPEPGADQLGGQRRRRDGAGLLGGDLEVEGGAAVEQEPGEDAELEGTRVASSLHAR
jgi:hypothetical protein